MMPLTQEMKVLELQVPLGFPYPPIPEDKSTHKKANCIRQDVVLIPYYHVTVLFHVQVVIMLIKNLQMDLLLQRVLTDENFA